MTLLDNIFLMLSYWEIDMMVLAALMAAGLIWCGVRGGDVSRY